VGTALLGPSLDGTCRAVFSVVTADGAIVQEHTAKGLDGLAPPGTIRPILGGNGNAQNEAIEPRFGVIMNPYTQSTVVVRQLFVSEPFYDTIAVVDLTNFANASQVFGLGDHQWPRSWRCGKWPPISWRSPSLGAIPSKTLGQCQEDRL
jgi:hypothetical protein